VKSLIINSLNTYTDTL